MCAPYVKLTMARRVRKLRTDPNDQGEESRVQRLQRPERESLPPEERRFYDAVRAIRRRPISGPFIVLTNSSADLAARFAQLGHYFHSRGQADESIVPLRDRGFI